LTYTVDVLLLVMFKNSTTNKIFNIMVDVLNRSAYTVVAVYVEHKQDE